MGTSYNSTILFSWALICTAKERTLLEKPIGAKVWLTQRPAVVLGQMPEKEAVCIERVVRAECLFEAYSSRCYSVDLRFPDWESSTLSRKEFYGGLLEPRWHPWRDLIQPLKRKQQCEIASSLFLLRKLLPGSDPCLESYKRKLTSESPSPDPSFIGFLTDKVNELFPIGWDKKGYGGQVLSAIPNDSSCREYSRQKGGNRKGLRKVGRDSFMDMCLQGTCVPEARPSALITKADCGDKVRIVTKSSWQDNLLRPLHKCIYDHLSQFPWLLRGDATRGKFGKFYSVEGEEFVSGDYESATDNLNIHVQKQILYLILSRCRKVPWSVRKYAMQVFSNDIDGSPQLSGQMMGALLSFPLLCLVNYLAFKYAVRRDVPVFINGDDIVFRARPSETENWIKEVSASGLTLSRGKTMRDPRFWSINSTFFYSKNNRVKYLQVPRWKSLFADNAFALQGSYYSFVGRTKGSIRSFLSRWFLDYNRFVIYDSRRSITRGLGISIPAFVLKDAGMLLREDYYLSYPSEDEMPRDPSPIKGWKKISSKEVEDLSKAREMEKEFFRLCVQEAWDRRVSHPAQVKRRERNLIKALKKTRIEDFSLYKRRWLASLARRRKLLGVKVDITRWMETAAMKGSTVKFNSISNAKRDLWVPVDSSTAVFSQREVLFWEETESFRRMIGPVTFVKGSVMIRKD